MPTCPCIPCSNNGTEETPPTFLSSNFEGLSIHDKAKRSQNENGEPPRITFTTIPNPVTSCINKTPDGVHQQALPQKEMLQKQNSLDVPKDDLRKLAPYPPAVLQTRQSN